jgi:hypothetical protein
MKKLAGSGPFILLLVFAALVSLDYGNDQSFYYSLSAEWGQSFKTLYSQQFDHKGPIYYLFLKAFILLFGDNVISYHLINCIVLLSFFVVMFSGFGSIFTWKNVAIFIPTLFMVTSNGLIQLFQLIFVICGLTLLEREQHTKKSFKSSLFLAMSALIRVDGLLFVLAPVLGTEKFSVKLKRITLILTIILSVLFFLDLSDMITFSDWYRDNFVFNKVYSKMFAPSVLYYAYRPNLLMYIIFIFFGFNFKWTERLVGGTHYFLIFSFLSFCVVVLSGSEKFYHFLTPGVLILIFFFRNGVTISYARIFPVLLVLAVVFKSAFFDGRRKFVDLREDIVLLEKYNHAGIIVHSSGFHNLSRFFTPNYVKPDNNYYHYQSDDLPVSSSVRDMRNYYLKRDLIIVHKEFPREFSQEWKVIDFSTNLKVYKKNVYSK